MPLELLVIAPADKPMSRTELKVHLREETWWQRTAADGTVLQLTISEPAHGAEERIEALLLEVPTPISAELADEALTFVEQIAGRLEWHVVEPMSGAQIDSADRTTWVSELTSYVEEEEDRPSADASRWLAVGLEQPAWLLVTLAVAAFGFAAVIVLARDVSQSYFGTVIGLIGSVLLVVFLIAMGAWRSRGQRSPKP